MSFQSKNIQYFIRLLKEQRHLFSEEDLADLKEKCVQLPPNLAQLSPFISQWCEVEGRSRILSAMEAAHYASPQSDRDRPIGGLTDSEGDEGDERDEDYRDQIINAVLNNMPAPSPIPSLSREQQPSKP